MKIIKTLKRIHPSFIGKRTDRVKSSPVIPQLTTLDGSPLPLPSLLDFDPEYVKLKMTSNANRFQDNYENFQSRTVVITRDVKTVRIEISVRNSNLKGIILDFNMEMLQFKIDIIQHG